MYKYIILIICLLIIFNRWNSLIFLLLALLTFYIVKNVLTKAKQEKSKWVFTLSRRANKPNYWSLPHQNHK
jgi:c-di-AMP phosphodiesterase-like protein